MDSNPFSTRFVRPGAIDYLFVPDASERRSEKLPQSVPEVFDRLREGNWWGQIVGPHGTGKSTLVQSLLPLFANANRELAQFTVTAERPWLDWSAHPAQNWSNRTQVIVDGYEQLNWWTRWRLRRTAQKQHAGLLVTTHQDCGLPTLLTTRGSLETVRRLVKILCATQTDSSPPSNFESALRLTEDRFPQLTDIELQAAFDQHGGNVRETLFTLYDLVENRRTDRVNPNEKV